MAEERTRLGRGLAALIGDMGEENAVVERARGSGGPRKVPTAFVKASLRNPRKSFGAEDLEDLAQSIKERGIVQPVLVRPVGGERDRYEIIAGERRWRAAQKVGLHEIPVVVVEATDKEALEIAIIENVQRTDLDPLEEASGYQQLISEFNYTQEDLAKVIGKSRPHVANTLRLLNSSPKIQEFLRLGKLTAGHARAIMNAPNADALAERVAEEGLSVRMAEELSLETKGLPPASRPRPGKAEKDADTKALEKSLSDALGLKVSISHRGRSGGKIEIVYKSLEQLDDVCHRLQG